MNALASATIVQTKKAKKHLWENKEVGADLEEKLVWCIQLKEKGRTHSLPQTEMFIFPIWEVTSFLSVIHKRVGSKQPQDLYFQLWKTDDIQ